MLNEFYFLAKSSLYFCVFFFKMQFTFVSLNLYFLLSFAVNQTFFTMTNNMSLSTPRLWLFLHITSPQFVDKVCVISCLLINIGTFFTKNHKKTFLFFFFFYCLVPRNQLLSVASACKVLIEFSLLRLENPDEACAVSQVRGTTQNVTETLQYLKYFALILRLSHQSPVIQFCSFMLTKTFTVNWWLT